MSGVVHRGVADMDTSGPASVGRRLANGRQSPTAPLKIFGHAKKKINDIFIEISSYIDEGNQFLEGMSVSVSIFCSSDYGVSLKYNLIIHHSPVNAALYSQLCHYCQRKTTSSNTSCSSSRTSSSHCRSHDCRFSVFVVSKSGVILFTSLV